MSGFEVEKLPFALDAVQAWGEADPRHRNWPVVYVLNNDRDVYVGESLNAHGRMRQHLDSAEKRGLEWVRVVLDDTFNKSACLDLESFLIRMFSGEGRLPRRAHGGHLPRSRAPCNCDPPHWRCPRQIHHRPRKGLPMKNTRTHTAWVWLSMMSWDITWSG